MKKRLLSMLLALVMALGMFPATALAVETDGQTPRETEIVTTADSAGEEPTEDAAEEGTTGYLADLRFVNNEDTPYLTFAPGTHEYTFVVPSGISGSNLYIGALLSESAPAGSGITLKYNTYTTGAARSVKLTSSDTENIKVSRISSFLTSTAGNSCTIEVGVSGNIQTYTLNIYRYAGIQLNKTEMTIPVGSTPALTVSRGLGVSDSDEITWESSNTDVATVADGVVTAVAAGNAKITATPAANETYAVGCDVTVVAVEDLLVGRNKFGYLKDLDLTQADSRTETEIDFDFDPSKLWQEFNVNSNGSSIFLTATADEKHSDDYTSIVVNFEYSVDGGATWANDSSSKYDKNILPDGTVSKMFQHITVGDGLNMSFHAGETLLVRLIVGEYTPVTSASGATEENSDVYYFKVTQRAVLGGIAVASGDTSFELDQDFDAGIPNYVVKGFSGNTVKITPTIGRAAKDCKIYIGEQEITSGTAAELTVGDLPTNEHGYHYVTIDVKYEGTGTASNGKYTVTLAPGDYTPTITTQPTAPESCTQGDEAYMTIAAEAPNGNGTLTYNWKVAKNANMWSATDLGTYDNGAVKIPTETSGTIYLQCTVTNTYNGVTYEVKSEVVQVTIEAKEAAAPVIDINRSNFNEGGTYYLYEQAEFPLYTLANSPDNGTLTYEWFRSDRADYTNTDGSEPVSAGAGKIQWVGTSAIGSVQCLYPTFDAVGTWYYFCKITNTITLPDGTTSSAGVSSGISEAYTVVELGIELSGSGTESDPYLITSAEEMDHVAEKVNEGIGFSGMYLKVTQNITLSNTWNGIGKIEDGADTAKGSTVNGFAGTLYGASKDVTITIPAGRPGLLNYSNAATVKDLSFYGENIVGSAVVNLSYTNYGTDDDYNLGVNPICVTIENVTLKSGSKTSGAGLARGGGSGVNSTNIVSCVVESGVEIGSANAERIGSFVASLNGMIINSTSAATVYGRNHVGGLAGCKGETMGACSIISSSFTGQVIATGNWVGGIIGRGYSDASDGGLNPNTTAPNTPVVTINNCLVSGDVTGADYVGGLFGGEPVVQDCWANGYGSILNNVFYGTVTGTGSNVGAVIGYMNSMNENQKGSGNYYLDTCGAASGVGKVNGVSSDFDVSVITTAKTAAEMADGSVTTLLNEGETSMKNWVQGTEHPELKSEAVAYRIAVSGEYKNEYYIGEELDLTGLVVTAYWSDGATSNPRLDEVTVSGYDKNTRAVQTLILTYGAAHTQIEVTVLKRPESDSGNGDITVYFTMLGDSVHPEDDIDEHGSIIGTVHTLKSKNLETWISRRAYTVDYNATVWDVIRTALRDAGMAYSTSEKTGTVYIESITRDGVELAEFTNGNLSGWMYTLNGKHPELGVAQQFLENGDRIVFHYTDDYTVEQGSEPWAPGGSGGRRHRQRERHRPHLRRREQHPGGGLRQRRHGHY